MHPPALRACAIVCAIRQTLRQLDAPCFSRGIDVDLPGHFPWRPEILGARLDRSTHDVGADLLFQAIVFLGQSIY